MLGLNISSAFSSVITIYIIIPFILIPQLLFSGTIVKFDKLHKSNLSSYEYVPVIGDLMTTRWSYEALAVEQFKNNKYERNFFNYNMGQSQNNWYSVFLINILQGYLKECEILRDSLPYRQMITDNFYKLNYYIDNLNDLAGFGPIQGSWKANLNIEKFDSESEKEAKLYLDSLAGQFNKFRKQNIDLYNSVCTSIEAKSGRDKLIYLRNNYYNKYLERAVLDLLRVDQSVETPTRIIQKYEPGYMRPTSKTGRAHFYAPYKQIGNNKIDTYWFNLMVLWVVNLFLYITLYYNILQKLITFFENLKFTDPERK
jgi:hypothetical protein